MKEYPLSNLPQIVGKMIDKIILFFEENQGKYPDFNGKGGFFCLLKKDTGEIISEFFVRQTPIEKVNEYFKLAKEKARRLYHFLSDGHLTSFESRDEKNGKYGGAIVGNEFIYSFSGFTEKIDTLISIFIAFCMEDIEIENSDEMAERVNIVHLVKEFEAFNLS